MPDAFPPVSNGSDDVDRLFAHLDRVSAPDDLTARVLARTVERARWHSRLAWPWLVAGLSALALLTLAGYFLGASLAATDGLDVLESVADDLSLLATAPGDVLAALSEIIPWPLVALAGTSAVLVVWAAGRLVARQATTVRGRYSV